MGTAHNLALVSKLMNFDHFYFNGQKAPIPKIRKMIGGIFDPTTLAQKGGFLFRAGLENNGGGTAIHFGILPTIIEGQRSYHYTIALPESCTTVLTGALSATGELLLLPDILVRKVNVSSNPTAEEKAGYLLFCRDFTELFIDCGLSPNTPLDQPTKQVISELSHGLLAPTTASDIASFPCT